MSPSFSLKEWIILCLYLFWSSVLYYYPITAVTNYHNLSGLTQQCFILEFWWSEVWTGSHWAKMKLSTGLYFFLELLGKHLFLWFPASKGFPHSLALRPPSFFFLSQQFLFKPFWHSITLKLTLLSLSHLRTLVIT